MNHKYKRLQSLIDDENVKASDIDESLVTGYKGFYNRVVKRVIDIILALTITIIVSPILIITSLAIFIEDGTPILYRAQRGGFHGKTFRICKFRSMIKNADKVGGGTTALNDNRITKVGNIIRKTKIDEFSNLFNILTGEMSFIGPRPELLQYTSQYKGTEKLILEVRPGITDYSSIEFINLDEIVGSGNADEIYEEHVLPRKNKLRVKYAATVSFGTDMKLFFLTGFKVFQKAFDFMFRGKHK
ncbi:sugar transferase [Holdemania filiformis]|uniref:Sugar transferase n=1 Tax=Holdemania filiformis TaxID=61171 RepID=A0A412G5X4_9FIRM|nr:sugar transferase [Holdemania filiformis]RGR76257.1 sugar transferase [Holdemania filiformis]